MKKVLAFCALCFVFFNAIAADSSWVTAPKKVFKRGYIRAGICLPSKAPNSQATAIKNFRDGNIGSGMGYNFEFGHIFYFLSRRVPRLANVGLDWTILNFEYAPINGWNNYQPRNSNEYYIGEPAIMGAVATKLGPVVAINPVSKLVVEARVQAVYSARALNFSLDEYDQSDNTVQYINTDYNDAADIYHGLGIGVGCTVRYRFIGLSVDYLSSRVSFPYEAQEPNGQTFSGKEEIPFKNLSVKLNFTF